MTTEDEAYVEGETLAEVEGRRLRVVHCGDTTAVYAEYMGKYMGNDTHWQVDPEAGISIPDEHLASFIACLSCIAEANATNAQPKELEEES